MDKVLAELEKGFDGLKAELLECLRIPSVSGDPAHTGDVAHCARWLADLLARDGFDAAVEPTGGHPVVVARWDKNPGAPTLLVYGHYDVQPAHLEDGWTSDPFSPVERDGAIFARGATDDKGQLFCHIAAARAHLRATGALPVNLIFLIEGEEESGSANLESFILANRQRLACDGVVVSDTAQYSDGRPALTYGLRGLVCLEVGLKGSNHDLHSGSFGGAAPNPANILARMIAALTDEAGRITIPGFMDDVLPLQQWERDAWAALNYDEEALARSLGVAALAGEQGYTALERMWGRPTLDVNGLWSGYCGEGPKTIIPARAGAKLSCRLVPGQDPERVAAAVEKKLRALAPQGVVLDVRHHHAAAPVLLPAKSPLVEAASGALEAAWGIAPVMIREGGSIPVVSTLATHLDAPAVLMGFARPGDRAHGPDERFHLSDLHRGAKACCLFQKKYT